MPNGRKPVRDDQGGPVPQKLVHSLWISFSVSVSMFPVASSRMMIAASWATARAKARSWRCPEEMLLPPSLMDVA